MSEPKLRQPFKQAFGKGVRILSVHTIAGGLRFVQEDGFEMAFTLTILKLVSGVFKQYDMRLKDFVMVWTF